ncbi:sporulation-delaying protein SdpB family protein [Bacillus halotolerans]|uniref:sporulation-delaying protein SdpB family protein n=1 Tax=Bacillus halotolerans TaxID=260554 RepID=UPI00351863C9
MLENIKQTITGWDKKNPWTNVYGLARSIIALSSLLTLLVNHPSLIMKPASGISSYPACKMNLSLFCLGENNYMMLNLFRWVCIAILVLVVIGWRPRITGILHWYISYSLQSSLIVIDGGEQAAAVITFLLIPITLTDPRKWHWSGRPDDPEGQRTIGKITAFISYFVIRLQVAVLYFHSTVAKLSQQEWVDGTAVYYFAQEKTIGFNGFFQALTKPFVSSPFVVIPTWGTLLVQIVIFAALFAPKKHWRLILIIAVFMHEIFAVMLGLISFSLIMAGILILYLTPIDSTFQFTYIRRLKWNKKEKKGEVSV